MDVTRDLEPTSSLVDSISFRPASHAAEPFTPDHGLRADPGEAPSLALLREVAPQEHRRCAELLHSSLPTGSDALQDVLPQGNGFVHTVIEAYNMHRALIVRPDDVWLAILTQYCFFVNGNAEALRSTFVAHQGKRELTIKTTGEGDRYSMDPAKLARHMTSLIQEHIVDPSVRDWIMPSFSTTTVFDMSISAMVMMGTMKEYFSYRFMLMCGIPKVTIEGEKSDWEDILGRLEVLKDHAQTNTWYHLLRPVISRFVTAYDDPTSSENLDFWSKVAHESGGGSGPRWLSGWITAFCVFDEKGQWQGGELTREQSETVDETRDPSHLDEEEFDSFYSHSERTPYLVLDGFAYPKIDSGAVPCGYVYVDVKLDDNGLSFDTMFVAGLVGSQICSTKTESSPDGTRDTVRPFSAWWYFIKGEQPEQESEPEEQEPEPEEREPEPEEQEPTPLEPEPQSGQGPVHEAPGQFDPPSPQATVGCHFFCQDIVSRIKGSWDAVRRK